MKGGFVACAVVAAGCAAPAPCDHAADAAEALAAAERAFAAHSVRANAREAFLASFSPEGVIVRNGWVPARPALEAQSAAPMVLDWHPAYVEVARSGELGLSTGPWTLTPRAPGQPVAHGQFVSIWGHESGQWRVLADIGIAHPGPALESAPLETRLASLGTCDATALGEAEQQFAAAASREGVREALRELAAADVRLYRDGAPPRLGLDAAMAGGTAEAVPLRYTVDAMQAARSRDLAFAYGAYDGRAAGVWLRAWRCEGSRWRVALDVTNAAR